jgi:teichuronic acid biosynthesis glycosyltransferase TuaC
MNRRLRIGVVVNFLPSTTEPHRGRANCERVKALARLAEVRAYCLQPEYLRLKMFQRQRSLCTTVAGADDVPGATVDDLRYRALPFLTRATNGRACARVLTPSLREFRPDVIIGYFVYPVGFGALTAGSKLGIPTVIGAVGSDLRQIKGGLVRRLVVHTLRKSALVVSVSEELRQRAIALGASPEKCRTIYDGCDSQVFHRGDRGAVRAQLQLPENAELILFVGSLLPVKGVRELLEAAAVLIPARPNLRVVCIGEGPFDREFRERAAKSDMNDHVKFVGGVLPEEVANWMTAANVFCLPSHSEGTPNAITEALSCARPVVATEVGGIPQLVNSKCGILVPPGDPRRLATALSEALDRPWNENEIAASFRRSWDDWATEMCEVCCSVMRTPVAPGS